MMTLLSSKCNRKTIADSFAKNVGEHFSYGLNFFRDVIKAAPTNTEGAGQGIENYMVRFWNRPSGNTGRTISCEK